MHEGSAFLVLFTVGFFIATLVAWFSTKNASFLRGELSRLRAYQSKQRREVAEIQEVTVQTNEMNEYKIQGLTKLLEQRKSQFPWLASAIADFNALLAEREAHLLESKNDTEHVRAAIDVRTHAKHRREAENMGRVAKYRAEYYEKLFPWIADYVGDDVPDYAVDVSGVENETEDPATYWVTKQEYEKLASAEKYQKALDAWSRRKKSDWEAGREFERFIAYLYKSMGFEVAFTDVLDGFEGMGRDVIAKRGPELVVIQCKYWPPQKHIREKHIFQLFASSLEYAFRFGHLRANIDRSFLENPTKIPKMTSVMYTTTKLTEVAKEAARRLGVQFNELVKISDYPMIKCVMRNGEKTYHLPFDQHYDRVKVGAAPDRYAHTVKEAEQSGFRRSAWVTSTPPASGSTAPVPTADSSPPAK